MPADGHALLHPAERGYVFLTPVQATSQEVALGESLKLQVLIEAYPKLLHWGWEHTNPLKNSGTTTFKGQMIPGNNWYVLVLFYTSHGMFTTMLSLWDRETPCYWLTEDSLPLSSLSSIISKPQWAGLIRSRRTPPLSNLAAFFLENLVEVSITFVVWLFKFTLSLQEEIARVDEQYKKPEFPHCSSDLSHALWSGECMYWAALYAQCQKKPETLLCR